MGLDYFLKYLRGMAQGKKTVTIDDREFYDALNGEKIPVKLSDGFTTMTVEVLKYLSSDHGVSRDFVTELIEKDNEGIDIVFQDEIGRREYYSYDKKGLINSFEWAMENDKLSLSELEKYKLLKISCEFTKFFQKYQDDMTYAQVDERFVSLPVKSLIELLNEQDLDSIIASGRYKDLTIEDYTFALDTFLDKFKILEKYNLPKNMKDNLHKLMAGVDIIAINRCIDYPDNYLSKAVISDELRERVYRNMPEDFDDLEKSFYVYYQLCNILTYDEEQFARRYDKDYEIKHRDFDRLKEVTPENNKIVCYEFTAIYAAFLKELGVKFELVGACDYGKGHVSLNLRCGKFLVNADSVIGIIRSDLAYAKNGLKLTGFFLENENPRTQLEFEQKLEKVYAYLVKTETPQYHGNVRQAKTYFNELPEDMDLSSKVKFFIAMTNNSTLPPVDKFPYEIELKNKLFSGDLVPKENPKFAMNFLSHNDSDGFTEKYSAVTLITFNDSGVMSDYETNHYVSIRSNGAVDAYTYPELRYQFENNILSGTIGNNREVPGFSVYEMNRNFISDNDENKTRSR